MPRKFKLTFDRSNKAWVKVIKGKKHYFGKSKGKYDSDSYKEALERFKQFEQSSQTEDNSHKRKSNRKKSQQQTSRVDHRGWRPLDTIEGAADMFFDDELLLRYKSGFITENHVRVTATHLKYFLSWLGTRASKTDGIKELDADRYDGYWKHLNRLKNQGHISVHTANGRFSAMRMFYRFAWLREKINELPRSFAVRTCLPRNVDGVPRAFTIDEIRRLYSGCFPSRYKWGSLRCYILLALNCGFTPIDIGTLSWEDVYLDSGRISKQRTKTKVAGSWLLWDETVNLIKIFARPEDKALRDKHGRKLLFASQQNKPLHWRTFQPLKLESGQDILSGTTVATSTSITRRFSALRQRVFGEEERSLSFKHLRKTGAQLILDLEGIDDGSALAQMYLV